MSEDRDAFMEAIDDLDRALDRHQDMTLRMKQRIGELRRAREDGRPLREIVPNEQTPLLVQLLTVIALPILEPLRRLIPPVAGVIDISPIIAMFVLQLVNSILHGLLDLF